MSKQPMRLTTLETIGHLDFEPETPCEHSQHADMESHPADLLIRARCPDCPHHKVFGMCLERWTYAGVHGIYCRDCGWTGVREQYWKILEVLS